MICKPPRPKPRRSPPPAPREAEKVYSSQSEEESKNITGGVWLDALSSVLKRVPVYNAVMKEVDHRLRPSWTAASRVLRLKRSSIFRHPTIPCGASASCAEDTCLIVPAGSPIDGAIMLVEKDGHRFLRKVKKLDAMNVLLQSYDREYAGESCALPDITFVGRAVRVEFSL